MSTGFTDEQEQELLKLTNKTILLFFFPFLFGVSRSLVIFSRAECWMRVAWLQMWGEAKKNKGFKLIKGFIVSVSS